MKPACFGETAGFALLGAENEYGGGLRAKPGAESRQRGRVGDRIEVHHHQIVGRSQGDARREGVFPAVARRQGSRSHQGVKRRSWICGNAGPSEKCRPEAPGRNGFSPAERRRPDHVERERRGGREGERPSAAAFGQAPPQSTRLLGTSVHNVDQGYVCSVVSQNNTANVQREVGVIAAPARSATPRGGRARPVCQKKCVMLASRHLACRQPVPRRRRRPVISSCRLPFPVSFLERPRNSGVRTQPQPRVPAWSGLNVRPGSRDSPYSTASFSKKPKRLVVSLWQSSSQSWPTTDGSGFAISQSLRCFFAAGSRRSVSTFGPAPARNPLHAEFGLSGYPVKGEADPVPAGNSLEPVAHN